jgi:CelD/BcsL family acetyltransferase involved in cellulose biosynthesis
MIAMSSEAALAAPFRLDEVGVPGLAVSITEVAAAANFWTELERDCIGSPYQRLDWVRAFVAAGVEPATEVRVLTARDAAGRPVMVLPLAICRRFGLRVAGVVGGKHANYSLPLVAAGQADRLTEADLRAALRETGRRLGLDAFVFDNVPRVWDGRVVPLAEGGIASPSNAYAAELRPDGEETLKRLMSPDGRRKLRNKENNLRRRGDLAFVRARDPETVETILQAFLRQKGERFRAQGIRDPFEGPGADFIRRGALHRLDEDAAAIEISGLTLDGQVIAAFGGAVDHSRISGMFISFDPAFARQSLGDQLCAQVILDSAARGRTRFDLGVGEAEYKRRFCNEVEELAGVLLPVSLRGRAYAAGLAGVRNVKRRAKRSGRAMAAIRAARRLRARLGF